MLDAANPSGLQNYWKSNFLRELSDGAIDTFVEHSARVTSARTQILIEDLHGTVNRVGRDETAFPTGMLTTTLTACAPRSTIAGLQPSACAAGLTVVEPLWYDVGQVTRMDAHRIPHRAFLPRPRDCICPWAKARVPSPFRPV